MAAREARDNRRMDTSPWQPWLGRQETSSDVVAPRPCAALAATLDRDASLPPEGMPLPPLWHWLYFLPLARRSELGEDGHARRGTFLPPVPLPRRMWAGGRLAFHAPLRVGDAVQRTSTIESVAGKAGRSGPLVFVTVRHEIGVAGSHAPALVEWQDIVYRDAPKPEEPMPARPAPPHSSWQRRWLADDVLLFRYSALTFNGHRIHYDRRYVSEVERYPGLVVHGPLIATLLVELLREKLQQAQLRTFAFKALRPLFDGAPFDVCGEPSPGGRSVALWARDDRGRLAMEANADVD